MSRALIIDDERDICELIEMGLIGQGVVCTGVHSVKSAIKTLKEQEFDFVISDIRLPDGDGLDLLAHIQKHYPGLPVCMMTAHGNLDMAVRALRLGAFDFISKPFELKQLRAVCRAAAKEHGGEHTAAPVKNGKSKGRSDSGGRSVDKYDLIGEAEVICKVREMITRVARSQAPVFIHGESGTGKEVAARSIHHQSNRKDGPFIAVNCGAIPENLVESEFFGYKKGSFTGANTDQDGLFVAANGGTLFLDEVADLPLSMQVKLLRAIQERAVRPIGGDREESVDVRIISATHHNLIARVAEGKFREDLFYRLNVIGLVMPPLRDREGDVAILSRYLLDRLAQHSGYPQAKLSPEALKKLESYTFPGNVRELENILERALTFMEGDIIHAADIHIHDTHIQVPAVSTGVEVFTQPIAGYSSGYSGQHYVAAHPTEITAGHQEDDFGLDSGHEEPAQLPNDLEDYMQNMEKQLLLKALEDSNYNKTKAAEKLGISFRAIRYKLKKLGIE